MANSLCFFSKDSGGKGLGEEEERGELHKDCEDGSGEEDPAPACSGGDVGAADGGDAGGEPGEDAVDGLAFAAFFFAPGVC